MVDEVIYRTEFHCAKCGKSYKQTKHYQLFCSDSCENSINQIMQGIEDRRLNQKCIECGLDFRRKHERSGQRICDGCSHSKKYRIGQQKAVEYRQVHREKKKRKKISYEQLIKISERDRVFRDSGWTHFLKGRKWDRI